MFEFDFGHGEDLDLLRETVRSFAADRIAPRAAEIDANNEFPRDLWVKIPGIKRNLKTDHQKLNTAKKRQNTLYNCHATGLNPNSLKLST